MTATTQFEPAGDQAPTSGEFEGEIREFIRRDVAPWRRRQDPDTPADPPGESVNILVQRVAGASLTEIDNVIGELRSVRDFLRNEGDRVQREIAGYATVSQTAMASMKVISESMAQWRNSVGAPLSPRD
ncbi:MAG TPA: hypothetical protein VH249_09070 [Xanthobacteraceae bacterium]|jgi:hypothetical protein|nr:hypothetical protein [Xanthobacteraceae bacterium]